MDIDKNIVSQTCQEDGDTTVPDAELSDVAGGEGVGERVVYCQKCGSWRVRCMSAYDYGVGKTTWFCKDCGNMFRA